MEGIPDSVAGSSDVPRSIILQAAASFRRMFPELGFLRMASIVTSLEEPQKHSILNAALVFATSPQVQEGRKDTEALEEDLVMASFASPTLDIVQALLVLAMFEWGNCNRHEAWMMTDKAEVHNRTFWSCFVIDRLIVCGNNQPLTLPLEHMTIHVPVGEHDFAFGVPWSLASRRTTRPGLSSTDEYYCGINYYYRILVRGIDICFRILKWVIGGGRRQPPMAEASIASSYTWNADCPWNICFEELKYWRETQDQQLQYPRTSVAVLVSLGYGDVFAFLNLIYYVSLLFLCRVYIPFLPTPEAEPRGPVDPPLLEAIAPCGWWASRAADIFDSAAHITTILGQLDDMGTPFFNPFAGFCAFSAATMNTYVSNFPRMNLGKSRSAETLLKANFDYLERFRSAWKIGGGWMRILHNQRFPSFPRHLCTDRALLQFRTIDKTRKLYEKARQDHHRYRGKTRVDFEALEQSIQDYAGVSPHITPEDSAARMSARCQSSTSREEAFRSDSAAVALVNNAETTQAGSTTQAHSVGAASEYAMLDSGCDPTSLGDNSLYTSQWNETWPLWGEQLAPYDMSSIRFDCNINT